MITCKFEEEKVKQGVIQCQDKKIRSCKCICWHNQTGQLLRQNGSSQILDWGKKGCTAGKASSRGSEVVTSEQPNGQRICAVTMDLSEDGLN